MTRFQSSATDCSRFRVPTRVRKSTVRQLIESTYRRPDEPARAQQPPACYASAAHERGWYQAHNDPFVTPLHPYQSAENVRTSTRWLEWISCSTAFELGELAGPLCYCPLFPCTGPARSQTPGMGNDFRARPRSYARCVVLGQDDRGAPRSAIWHERRCRCAGTCRYDRSTRKYHRSHCGIMVRRPHVIFNSTYRVAVYFRAEYDREQAAIIEHEGRGLGGMGPWHGKDNWYGGRIQQIGRVRKGKGKGSFVIQLEKPEIRRSHRFSRYLGSRRVLQVRVAEELIYQHGDELREFLICHKFILCGRVFIPFHAKEGSVYMAETNQNYGRQCAHYEGDQYRISLARLIRWHNPFNLNSRQVRCRRQSM